MHYFLSLLLGLLNAWACAHFAKKRGRNPLYWFIWGALFGIFALAALFFFPVRRVVRAEPVAIPVEPLLQVIEPEHADKLWYYLDAEKKQCGPMSFHALTRAWTEGKVRVESWVWNDSLDDWKRLESVVKIEYIQTT